MLGHWWTAACWARSTAATGFWVVFSGDEPVAAYPGQQGELQDVIGRADLSQRVPPDEVESTTRLTLIRGIRR